jgi:adenylate kinase
VIGLNNKARREIFGVKIVLLGPPGAGKGTQAKILAEKYNVPHVSTGDIFRELIKNNSPLGIKIRKYVESGDLIPDEIVAEVVSCRIRELDYKKGFILDGFPRTVKQAEMLDGSLKELGIALDKVFYFETSIDVIIKRLSGRRTCKNCGALYHLTNLPPKQSGICDLCGGQLYQRKDDEIETIHNRIKIYNEQTVDVIDYYKDKKILETINGDLSKDDAFVVIEAILSKVSPL